MKAKTIQQWIEYYEKKCRYKEPYNKVTIPEGGRLFYLPTRGFVSLIPNPESQTLIVWQGAGDGVFWKDFAEIRAREMGFNKISTRTGRNIKAYLHMLGVTILAWQKDVDGNDTCFGQDNLGRAVLVCGYKSAGDCQTMHTVTLYLDNEV